MRNCYEVLEQELRGLRRQLTIVIAPPPSTRQSFILTLAGNHVPRIGEFANQTVTKDYPYVLFITFFTMTAFFVEWALWEKMTFCLGLAIVLAIILGLAKNMYSRWRLRSYSTVEERLLDSTPAMIEARVACKIDAPFGVRALESGVEIEGVWISRSNLNTPVQNRPHSPAGSSSSSFFDEPTTPSFAIIEGAKPRARTNSSQSLRPLWYAPSKRASDGGSTASWTIDTNGFQKVDIYRPRPTSSPAVNLADQSGHTDDSNMSDSSSIHRMKRSECRHTFGGREALELTPTALTASSDDYFKPQSSSTMATSPATSMDGSELSKATQDSSLDFRKSSELGTADKGIRNSEQLQADLGLLYTHRLSHVAETGQLIPRSKRSPKTSGDWSRTAPARPPRPRHPPISMHNKGISRSLPTTPVEDVQNPFDFATASQNTDTKNSDQANGPQDRRVSMDDAPKDGHLEIDVLDMVLRDRFYEQHDGAVSAIATLPRPELAYGPSTLEHKRGSEVLRRINEGFEILKPGTISEAAANVRPSRAHSHDRNKRHSRRLSKERPSTGGRDRNSFIEVLYGNERRPRL